LIKQYYVNANIVCVYSVLTPIFGIMIFNENTQSSKFYRISILVWLLFISYEILFSYLLTGQFSTIFDYFTSYTINISLFYVNALVVLPYIYRRPIYIGILAILLELIGYTLVKYGIALLCLQLGQSKINPLAAPLNYFISSVWRFIYFMGISIGYWFSINVMAQRKEITDLERSKLMNQLNTQELEKKLMDSDIAYLKAQINPHFLFNTLNFIYNSTITTAPALGKPVLLLSDVMRYALAETTADGKVELADEIEQINTFITLYQYRFDENLKISFTINGQIGAHKILPLLLLTLVENVFKYADLKNEEHPVKIDLQMEGNNLKFTTWNKKLKRKRPVISKGIGLKNLKSRLDAYYPNTYKTNIIDDDDIYIFELEIIL